MNIYIIYRNRKTNRIERYSEAHSQDIADLQSKIVEYNLKNENSDIPVVELVTGGDLLDMILISENKYHLHRADLRSIEHAIDDLVSQLDYLKDSIPEQRHDNICK